MKTLMLAVGINDYADPRVPDLRLCVPDAQMMLQSLTEMAQNEVQSRLLLNGEATKAAIREGIEWLEENAERDDRVIFYFSGHGARYEDTSGDDEEDLHDEFLCPADLGTARGVGSLIRDDELREWLAPLSQKTDKVAIIFDCCHSGTATMAPSGAVPREVPPDVVEEIVGDYRPAARGDVGLAAQSVPGQLLLAAAQDYQSSYELPGWENGLFTACLLKGLADEKMQTFQELFDYASEEVATAAEQYNVDQSPNVVDGLQEGLPLR